MFMFRLREDSSSVLSERALKKMVVDHAYRLHERVCRHRTDELPADSLQFSGHDLTLLGPGWYLCDARWSGVGTRGEGPQECCERSLSRELLVQNPGVVDDRFDLGAVANKPLVEHEFFNSRTLELGEMLWIKSSKSFAQSCSASQDDDPTEPRLEGFQAEFFEQRMIVVARDSPFLVVVFLVERIPRAPWASQSSICTCLEIVHWLIPSHSNAFLDSVGRTTSGMCSGRCAESRS